MGSVLRAEDAELTTSRREPQSFCIHSGGTRMSHPSQMQRQARMPVLPRRVFRFSFLGTPSSPAAPRSSSMKIRCSSSPIRRRKSLRGGVWAESRDVAVHGACSEVNRAILLSELSRMLGMPMWVVRRIRVSCPNLSTSLSTQEEHELTNTNHGRSACDSLLRPLCPRRFMPPL